MVLLTVFPDKPTLLLHIVYPVYLVQHLVYLLDLGLKSLVPHSGGFSDKLWVSFPKMESEFVGGTVEHHFSHPSDRLFGLPTKAVWSRGGGD